MSEEQPIILAVETSGRCGSMALVSRNRLIAEYSLDTRSTHSKRLLSGIDWLMKETELSWDQLDAIAVSLGPGSFTGLRIGLSAVKGIAMATNTKMLGVPTLDALACQFPFVSHAICPVIDARKNEVYTARYRFSEAGIIERITGCRAIRPELLLQEIKEPTLFVGDGISIYGDLFKEKLGRLALFPPSQLFFARAAAIGKLALAMWDNNEFIEPAGATPIYIRKSDAELHFGKPKE